MTHRKLVHPTPKRRVLLTGDPQDSDRTLVIGADYARGVLPIHRQQLEDLHRALAVAVGQERKAVGERLRSSEIVSFDD